MRLFTRDQSKICDQIARTEYGLTTKVLMENAGTAVAEEIHLQIKDKRKKILILAGPGNNGADGFVASRMLKRKGFQSISVLVVENPHAKNEEWDYQLERAKNSQVQILNLTEGSTPIVLTEADVVVDAIFGTGLEKPLNENISGLVRFLNSRNCFVVSVDVPSGLDVNTGLPIGKKGIAVKADLTVTFGYAKAGFLLNQGPRHIGKLRIHTIGFPKECLRKASGTEFAFGQAAARRLLPNRNESSHKSKNGTVVVFAGSDEFPGAGVLAARAAGRAGAGYVWLVNFSSQYQEVLQIPEVIVRSYKSSIFDQIKKEATIVMGPGLGTGEKTKEVLLALKKKKFENVVLDADALTVCESENLFPLPQTWIITPHSGELARILDKESALLDQDRLDSARKGAKASGAICLFKGFRSIVSDGIRNIICLSGNPALSKAGTGDVLSGFIGAFLAQGLSPSKAVCLGTYLHGRLADDWLAEGKDVISLLPSDLNERIAELIQKLRNS